MSIRATPYRILIVDDSPEDRKSLHRFLNRTDEVVYLTFEAESGEEALSMCESVQPDCILLDYRLPDFDGLELLDELKRRLPHVPIVMMTGQGSEAIAVAAMNRGARDYLIKGKLERDSLQGAIRYSIEREKRSRAERELQETKGELAAAHQIQKRLFPHGAPQIAGLDIAGECRAALETGGDYYDFIPMRNGRLGIVVADVSSHGLGPALVMAGTRRLLRTLIDTHDDLDEILTLANQAIDEDTDDGQFVTLFLVAIDPPSKSFRYAAAGHIGYLFDDQDEVGILDSTSLPLGVTDVFEVARSKPVKLPPGALLLMITDGFAEAQSPGGDLYGEARVLNVVADHRHRSAQEIVSALFDDVAKFCQPESPKDDLTVVIIKALS